GLCWSNAGSASGDALIFVIFFFLVGLILLVLTPNYGLYFIALNGASLLGTVLLYFSRLQ
ncbi:DUOXAlike protein C06E13like, partial [Caligus rogercresseyi]